MSTRWLERIYVAIPSIWQVAIAVLALPLVGTERATIPAPGDDPKPACAGRMARPKGPLDRWRPGKSVR